VIAGELYVTGGPAPGHEAGDGKNLSSTEVYDPAANAWSSLPDLPTPDRAPRRRGGVGEFATRDGQRLGFGGVKHFWGYSPP